MGQRKKKKVKIIKVKNNRKNNNSSNDSISRRKRSIIVLFIIIILLLLINTAIKSYKWLRLTKDMHNLKTSIVVDNSNNTLANIGAERKTIYVSGNKIPTDLKNAYIAIEDQRFYSHIGIDVKRTGGAIFTYIKRFGKSSFGGSTITQQLAKNLTGESDKNIARKIKEWGRAIAIDAVYSKDEILDYYLNIIYIGPNSYGVGAGAKYYFNKDVSELNLAESAFLAGINNAPNSYKPFENNDEAKEKIKKRTKTVLAKMLELGYIDQSKYDQAVSMTDAGLTFKNGNVDTGNINYSYHTDALINECIDDIAKKYNISKSFAINYMQLAGLKIYSTVDGTIQKEIENECVKSKYILKSAINQGETSQAAMVIIEPHTGKVLGCYGGLGEKKVARGLNRATQSTRQTGSSIKPLSVLIPGLNERIFTASTIYDDTVKEFEPGYFPEDYNQPLGNITVRRALESSQNIPFLLMIQEIGLSKSIDYLKEMGITSLSSKDESLTLALGGFVKGITPLEMAGAYNTIANDGVYIEPTFYNKIEKRNGKVLLKSNQKSKRIIEPEVASLLQNLLQQPVLGPNGTATYCKIDGVDVCAKTGTSDENYDRWLCGFTPYYTAVTWFGFDQNESINFNQRNPAGLIWTNVMHRVHAGKISAHFKISSELKACKVCSKTGLRARTNCPNSYTEYYLSGTVPKLCTEHSGNEVEIVVEKNTTTNDNNKSAIDKVIKEIKTEIDAIDPQEVQSTANDTKTIEEKPTANNIVPTNANSVENKTNINNVIENKINDKPKENNINTNNSNNTTNKVTNTINNIIQNNVVNNVVQN